MAGRGGRGVRGRQEWRATPGAGPSDGPVCSERETREARRLVRKDAGSERLVAYSGRGGTGLGRVTQKRAGEAEPGPQHIDHNRRQGATRACRDSPEWAEVTPPRSSQLLL